eukprot:CAMPEP_0179083122 /NCGR_PEP_ID=MMETSP0796-20121207/37517_1 /TAXON_ID=73915 /ORGANISM="Pyrodinium bahamense, Strain pbaha01" /LENGTH=178 /DNA_ID=CAMNT_0020780523 /DNA_START=49 /DNA_END=585 /DNA_ORIENTATION=-
MTLAGTTVQQELSARVRRVATPLCTRLAVATERPTVKSAEGIVQAQRAAPRQRVFSSRRARRRMAAAEDCVQEQLDRRPRPAAKIAEAAPALRRASRDTAKGSGSQSWKRQRAAAAPVEADPEIDAADQWLQWISEDESEERILTDTGGGEAEDTESEPEGASNDLVRLIFEQESKVF